MAVVQHSRPFAAADLAGLCGRADDLGETSPLRFGDRLAESARFRAIGPAAGPGIDIEVCFLALLAAPPAAALCVDGGGARRLLRQALAIHEEEQVRGGVVERDKTVAQLP
jgi:hypothetical protein